MFISVILALAALVVSYLLGSINTAVLISKFVAHDDVREHGSGNAGTTNMVRILGAKAGAITFLCDMLKSAVAVLLGRFVLYHFAYQLCPSSWFLPIYGAFLCGFFAVLGHSYPIYFGFKGGKGVASGVGVMFCIDWRVTLCALGIFIILFLWTRIVSVGSIVCAAALIPFIWLFYPLAGTAGDLAGSRTVITLLSFLLPLFIIYKHIPNIRRLIRGEEKKLSFHKHKEE